MKRAWHPRSAAYVAAMSTTVLTMQLAGCGSSNSLTGELTLTSLTAAGENLGIIVRGVDHNTCSGVGGYRDIDTGTSVTVRDGTGKIVGLGSLSVGKPGKLRAVTSTDFVTSECTFGFTVKAPKQSIYTVEVAHRGAVPINASEAGHVALTLGG